MNNRFNSALIDFLVTAGIMSLSAQCDSWIGKPTHTVAENAHSIYRQALKANDYTTAFENWQIAFKLAPVDDVKRGYHFKDGL